MNLEKLFDQNPYSLSVKKKESLILNKINKLTKFHNFNCKEYKKILNFFKYNPSKKYNINDLPFLPVQIFKEVDLFSTAKKNIVKILRSSGTTSAQTSRIFLDKKNSLEQVKALKKIGQYHIGDKR